MLEIKMEPGTKKKTELAITDSLAIRLWMVRGARPGKTLLLTTGVHGGEYVGIAAAQELFAQLDPTQMSGTVILLPLINEEGFLQGAKQIFPQDGKNLNRVFPGLEAGSITEQIAYQIEKQLYPHADFILDLHGGDISEAMTPLVFYPVAGAPEVNYAADQAARCLPVAYRVASRSTNGLYSHAVQCGIPGLLLEIGGAGRWTRSEVELCIESVHRVLGCLGICGKYVQNELQLDCTETRYLESPVRGMWYPEVTVNQRVEAGALLGYVRDLEGSAETTLYAEFDAVILYHTVSLGVQQGEALVAYTRI